MDIIQNWPSERWREGSTHMSGFRVVTRSIRIQTQGDGDVVDVTRPVQERIGEVGLKRGTVTVFVQGSTAALTTVEYEPGLISDLRGLFERIAPSNIPYQHDQRWHDGNGHSHLRASLLGPSLTIPFAEGFMTLGTWQQIVVLDFDNRPRYRELVVQMMGE
ncbi:MAG: secondary thiamine-phosphate synthase enzyme YjbQ [Chloroflexota bacterium]